MSMWTFLTIIIVTSILAGTISEYLKKEKATHSRTSTEIDNLNKEIGKLRKRVENLETIAAGDPDEFSDLFKNRQAEADREGKKAPADEINDIIKKRRNKSW